MELARDDALLLQAMEEAMWRAETRFDRAYMDAVLAPGYVEIGQSGRIYTREQVLDLPYQEIDVTLPLTDFRVEAVCSHGAMVLYTSVPGHGEHGAAHRSSIWVHEDRWRLRYHQATPVDL
ncbi:nuclear transport factor 2 family protein [Demequina salsinemoris]|uniref:nuclear transport factor 2 family protein n=1 Tax=Demequina salsinemoris TaxID=577470 RepID=UPI0007802E45|nr:nuclear transport factor 2 family protein [Demequina salsinemoris]